MNTKKNMDEINHCSNLKQWGPKCKTLKRQAGLGTKNKLLVTCPSSKTHTIPPHPKTKFQPIMEPGTKTRNIRTTGRHSKKRKKDKLTKTTGHTQTKYTRADWLTRHRWTQEKRLKSHKRRTRNAKHDTWGQNVEIKQEITATNSSMTLFMTLFLTIILQCVVNFQTCSVALKDL